jgi:hypothetical protein
MSWRFDLQNLSPEQRAILVAKEKREEILRKDRENHQSQSKSEIWVGVRNNLSSNQAIPNWTAYRGYLGDAFEVAKVDDEHLEIESPNAENLIRVSREDFENVWKLWSGYKSGKVQRQEIRDQTRNSKYVISILHWMETEKKT